MIYQINEHQILIDDTDTNRYLQYRWRVDKLGYVFSCFKRKKIYLHRVIMSPPKGMVCDHINHNKLDNRRENLRVCSARQNTINSVKAITGAARSKYKGVARDRVQQKWRTLICHNGHSYHLYQSDSELECAYAYNVAVTLLHKQFAYLNQIEFQSDSIVEHVKRKLIYHGISS